MTSRLRRVEPGEPITAAAFNALVDALNQALRITGAFPVEVRRHPGGTHIELVSSLSSGGVASARILHFDGDDWIDADSDTIEVHDAIGSLEGNPGDHALVRFHRQSGRWLVWQLQC
jgi:hypothetical protein